MKAIKLASCEFLLFIIVLLFIMKAGLQLWVDLMLLFRVCKENAGNHPVLVE